MLQSDVKFIMYTEDLYFASPTNKIIYWIDTMVMTLTETVLILIVIVYFYAPGLKGPPGASSNWIDHLFVCPSVCLSVRPSVRLSVCLSVRPSVRNSVPLTNKLQYLKFGWWYSNQTWTVGSSHFTDITCPWGWGGVKI